MGVGEVCLIVFIILKCVGVIDWSWGLVLLPLWIDLGLYTILTIIKIIIRENDKRWFRRTFK